ncbi:MAG: TMEM143 family protein [Caldilineaceae bacterium]
MTEQANLTQPARESFIPYSREELIDLCIEDGRLSAEDVPRFRAFCEILAAYYNFEFHKRLESLKRNYTPFDPDAVDRSDSVTEAIASKLHLERFAETMRDVLEAANYTQLDDMAIHDAIANSALIDLKTEVDFNDFEEIVFYYREAKPTSMEVKRFFFWKRKVETDIFSHVVLGIKYKAAAYFHEQKRKIDKLNFTPGLMYLYMYKSIPRYDLELLFPNVQLRMNLIDRLMFVLPALGAGVMVLMKALPNLLLVLALILFLTMGPGWIDQIGVKEDQIKDFTPVLFAFFSLSAALGGFAFKQYSGYQTRRMKFMKDVTDTLFFKSIATNSSVFHTVIDAAEEEEAKEVILVYYHLLTSGVGCDPTELDGAIEAWLAEKNAPAVDFDMDVVMRHMQAVCTTMCTNGSAMPRETALLEVEENGDCRVLSLLDAKRLLDKLWDEAFDYNR